MNLSKETEEPDLNPFTSIWTKPRQTVRQIIKEHRSGFIFLLLVLAGYSSILLSGFDTAGNEIFGLWGLVIGGLLVSPIVAAIGNSIASLLSLLIGKIFKGTATYSEMFRAQLAGQIPQMWLIPVFLLYIFFMPSSYFTNPDEATTSGISALNFILSVIVFIVTTATLFYQSKAIGEAHGLSAWKGLIILLIPMVVFFVIIALLLFSVFF